MLELTDRLKKALTRLYNLSSIISPGQTYLGESRGLLRGIVDNAGTNSHGRFESLLIESEFIDREFNFIGRNRQSRILMIQRATKDAYIAASIYDTLEELAKAFIEYKLLASSQQSK